MDEDERRTENGDNKAGDDQHGRRGGTGGRGGKTRSQSHGGVYAGHGHDASGVRHCDLAVTCSYSIYLLVT